MTTRDEMLALAEARMQEIADDDAFGKYGRLAREAIEALRTAAPAAGVEINRIAQLIADDDSGCVVPAEDCGRNCHCRATATKIAAILPPAAVPAPTFDTSKEAVAYLSGKFDWCPTCKRGWCACAAGAEQQPVGYVGRLDLEALKDPHGVARIIACAGYDAIIPLYAAPLGALPDDFGRKIEQAWDAEPTPFNRADVAVRVVNGVLASLRKSGALADIAPERNKE